MNRFQKLKEQMITQNLDVYLIGSHSNIRYFTENIVGSYVVIPLEAEPTLFVSILDANYAYDKAKNVGIQTFKKKTMIEKISKLINELKPKKIGFDIIPISIFNKLKEKLSSIELLQKNEFPRKLRSIKDDQELRLLSKAGKLADEGMQALSNILTPGLPEFHLAAESIYTMIKNGAEGYAFDLSIASGERSAYPHAGITSRKIREGDFVTVDLGATVKGYRSDLTRTFIIGKPSEKQKEIYETVLTAQKETEPKLIEGAYGKDVDAFTREIIKKAGYGDYFTHSLGHGVGLDIHEAPSLSASSKDKLEIRNVLTNEPGIYIHHFGGVRIEDTVQITKKGPKRMTIFPKELEDIIS
jgi:Xaa-Pro aminopeptidase